MNIRALRDVYQILEDDESKDLWLGRLNWLLSNDYRKINDIAVRYDSRLDASPCRSYQEIRELVGESPIMFYGAGSDAVWYQSFLKEVDNGRIIGFLDTNMGNKCGGYMGFSVFPPEALKMYNEAYVLITSSAYEDEIKEILRKMNFPQDQIIDGIFPKFKVVEDQYFDDDILNFEDGEIFIDGGAYDLSASIALCKKTNVKKIYAVEADPNNVKLCVKRKEELRCDEVEIVPCGLWSKTDRLMFEASGNSAATFYGKGSVSVPVKPLDALVKQDERITFIKMDIEGAELEGLKGSRMTIQKYKPKLAICIYHKIEDMYELPLFIKTLVPEYKFYLRNYSNRPYEVILYAVP